MIANRRKKHIKQETDDKADLALQKTEGDLDAEERGGWGGGEGGGGEACCAES